MASAKFTCLALLALLAAAATLEHVSAHRELLEEVVVMDEVEAMGSKCKDVDDKDKCDDKDDCKWSKSKKMCVKIDDKDDNKNDDKEDDSDDKVKCGAISGKSKCRNTDNCKWDREADKCIKK